MEIRLKRNVNKKSSRREFLKRGCLLLTGVGGSLALFDLLNTKAQTNVKTSSLHEAMFYQKLDNNKVGCQLCFRKCIIAEGKRGFCRVRENRDGRLFSLVYGKPAELQIDPIELEPMYHLVPAHRNICVFTASCNFRCKHCHNWHITTKSPEELTNWTYTPEQVIEQAIKNKCRSISHSINEPTIFFEYMYDIVKIAKQEGLLTLFHTNGSLNAQPLKMLLKYMDGVTVDLKSFNEIFYRETSSARLAPVLETLKIIKQEGVHLEIVNLIIPTLNDELDRIRQMCIWIKETIGEETPVHFTRFSPAYKLTKLPHTPVKTLEAARNIAQDAGLEYVYIGNLPGHEGNNTYCPHCKKMLIHRIHFTVLSNDITNGKCKFCNHKIRGIWE